MLKKLQRKKIDLDNLVKDRIAYEQKQKIDTYFKSLETKYSNQEPKKEFSLDDELTWANIQKLRPLIKKNKITPRVLESLAREKCSYVMGNGACSRASIVSYLRDHDISLREVHDHFK